MLKQRHKVLFEPMNIGSVTLKNRYSMAPMGTLGCVDSDGAYNQRGIEYYVERAKGGVGLIITGVQMVENDIERFPMPSLPCPTYNPTAYIRSARELTERVHAYGCKIFAQLTAGWGRSCVPGFITSDKAIAPSAASNRFDISMQHRELTHDEIQTIIAKFVQAASIAKKAGFDGVEIHAVHEGYLLDQFTLSYFNQRTDEYGGCFANRFRIIAEILQGIKAACGNSFPVSIRYSVKSNMKGYAQGILPGEQAEEVGRDIEEGLEAAKYLEELGYDALNVDAGTYDSWYWNHPPNYFQPGMYRPYCKVVKEVVNIPVLMSGRMEDPDMASQAVTDNIADGISLGRPLLADPEVVNKIRRGAYDQVRPCLSCHLGCLGRMAEVGNLSCAVNPSCGREAEYRLIPALQSKRIVIVGGGVAGMECARVATLRGHKVVLFEQSSQLGGNVIAGSQAPFKHDDKKLIDWYSGEMKRQLIDIRFNSCATKEAIEAEEPDCVIFATGSKPIVPKSISGSDLPNVILAEDVLLKPDLINGDIVTVVGGGLVGSETALWLAQKGKCVTLIEAADDLIGGPHGTCFANYQMLHELLRSQQVDIRTSTYIKRITSEGVEAFATLANSDEFIASDHVVLAIGYSANSRLYDQLHQELDVDNVYNIGDSQKARTIMMAIWEGYEIASSL